MPRIQIETAGLTIEVRVVLSLARYSELGVMWKIYRFGGVTVSVTSETDFYPDNIFSVDCASESRWSG